MSVVEVINPWRHCEKESLTDRNDFRAAVTKSPSPSLERAEIVEISAICICHGTMDERACQNDN